jgi:CubicO group peptidase (beta-lactamase class C family)
MSSGVFSAENKLIRNTRAAGGLETILEFRSREAPPGTRFQYASGDSQVLGFALEAALRQPLATYLSEKIWQPMGAEANATWIVDKERHETGYCCINATLRDYGRFGMLLANYGALDGRQIIPAGWVRAATTPSAPHLAVGTATPNNGYGYQTWITHRTEPRFAALGLHGQAIMVDPVSKLVVVHTAVWSLGDSRPARGAQFRLWQALLDKLAP